MDWIQTPELVSEANDEGVRTGLSVQEFIPISEIRASEAHPSALAKLWTHRKMGFLF